MAGSRQPGRALDNIITTDRIRYDYGCEIVRSGGVNFRLWSPAQDDVSIVCDNSDPTPMEHVGRGWKFAHLPQAKVGDLYHFALPDGTRVPDPASRYQPRDVHGPSQIIDPEAYRWTCEHWRGRPWSEAILYELHVGCFTPDGTFRSAAERLPYLSRLGVTALEVMPVADFPGERNWGYDGVLPFAPGSAYGTPDDFRYFVDQAHECGLMVLLDVVYNHFGPEGNYLHVYAPAFFSARDVTPWGAAINFDGANSEHVRRFYVENALYWLHDFRLDGLRFDAAHAIHDKSRRHILHEIAREVRRRLPREHIHLIVENEENDASWLGKPDAMTAQWNDDVHHVLHVAATSEATGYYADYIHDTDMLGRSISQGFGFQGQNMPYRGSLRGKPSGHLSPAAFVAFIQNHDQIGNRALGERLTHICAPARLKAIAAIYLLLPQIPMMFMGEEWGASSPFQFFCDFSTDLADAVRTGRRKEFERFPEYAGDKRNHIPDPVAPETFERSKLVWSEIDDEPHSGWLVHYTSLISLRKEHVLPLLPKLSHGGDYAILGHLAVAVEWTADDGSILRLEANLGGSPVHRLKCEGLRTFFPADELGEKADLLPFDVIWSVLTREAPDSHP